MFSKDQIKITYEYLPPRNPPPEGSSWSEDLDYPGVRAHAWIPGETLPPEVVNRSHMFFDHYLEARWGDLVQVDQPQVGGLEVLVKSPYRTSCVDFRAATLAKAEVQALEYVQQALANLDATVLEPRRKRLKKREETIASAHANTTGLVTVPSKKEA